MGKALNASRWVLPGLAVAVATVVGCGISDITEGVFSSGTDPGGSGGSSTTTSMTTTTTVNPTTTTTSGGGQGQGGAGGESTGGMGGTGGTGGGTGGGTVGITLACGDAPDCSVPPSSACCWSRFEAGEQCIMGPPDPATCDTSNTFNGRHTRIECQLPSHCAGGEVCCGTFVGGGANYYSEVACRAQCNSVTLCDPANPVCPQAGQNCQQSGSLPDGYFVCIN